MKNYTIVLFLLLFVASISGGLVFKSFFTYSMLLGVGLGVVFLLSAVFFHEKRERG